MSVLYLTSFRYGEDTEFDKTFDTFSEAKKSVRNITNHNVDVSQGYVTKLPTGDFANDEHEIVYSYPSLLPA